MPEIFETVHQYREALAKATIRLGKGVRRHSLLFSFYLSLEKVILT